MSKFHPFFVSNVYFIEVKDARGIFINKLTKFVNFHFWVYFPLVWSIQQTIKFLIYQQEDEDPDVPEGLSLHKTYLYSKLLWSVFSQTEYIYWVSLRIQSECGKLWTRITPNTVTLFKQVCDLLHDNVENHHEIENGNDLEQAEDPSKRRCKICWKI